MGNFGSSDGDGGELVAAMEVLGNREASEEEKRKAFVLLQNEYAPNIQDTNAYAAELTRVFAKRYTKWEGEPSVLPEDVEKYTVADRIRGLIYGQALGDAVGKATEFLTTQQVNEYYPDDFEFRPGCDVKPDSHRFMFPFGDWTDDTDQLILLLENMLQHNGKVDPKSFAKQLRSWSADGFKGLGDKGGAGLGKHTKQVLTHELFLEKPLTASRSVWEFGGKKSAPNGAVMRTAITGVSGFWNKEFVERNTITACQVTHADPRCTVSCLVVSLVAAGLIHGKQNPMDIIGDELAESVSRFYKCGGNQAAATELDFHMNVSSIDQLQLGGGYGIGYTFKCAGCAIWAIRQAVFRVSEGQTQQGAFKHIIQEITRCGGDADTNAAPAGALIGAYIGFTNLPKDWVNELAYGAWLEAWVQKILYMLDLPISQRECED